MPPFKDRRQELATRRSSVRRLMRENLRATIYIHAVGPERVESESRIGFRGAKVDRGARGMRTIQRAMIKVSPIIAVTRRCQGRKRRRRRAKKPPAVAGVRLRQTTDNEDISLRSCVDLPNCCLSRM